MNFYSTLETNAGIFADSPAVIDGATGAAISYQELRHRVEAVACGLSSIGIGEGDRVALYLPNCPEFIVSYFAILKIGAIAVPFNIFYKSHEIKHILKNSGAKAVIGADGELSQNLIPVRRELADLLTVIGVGDNGGDHVDIWFNNWLSGRGSVATAQVDDYQPASILYTSGTTGQPKGAMLSHRNIAVNAKINGHYLLGLNDQDIALGASPFNHVYFVQIVLGPMVVGASVVTLPRSSPDLALAAIEKFKVTHFSTVPTMFRYMVQRFKEKKYNVASWRVAGSAAASINAEMVDEIEGTFGVDFFEAYGSTEVASTATYTRLRHPRPGSIGLPAPGYLVKLLDDLGREAPAGEVGELSVKGPGVFLGYWGMPESTREAFTTDGWYKSGDLARRDEEGYLHIVDRKKDMIVSGGYNVYPREVEDVLLSHPDIAEAAVVGKPDDNLGEVPVGYIIPKPGVSLSEEAVTAFCKERLAKYKIPRVIDFVQDFPRTSSGKILKRMLP